MNCLPMSSFLRGYGQYLVYADLLDDPKSRNLETAKHIYNNYVKNTL